MSNPKPLTVSINKIYHFHPLFYT